MPSNESLLKRLAKIADEVEKENPPFAAVARRPDGKRTLTFGEPRDG